MKIFLKLFIEREKRKKKLFLQLFINSIKIVLNFFKNSPLINILKTGLN